MDILIKNALILSPGSKNHGEKKDILVEKGKIKSIGKSLNAQPKTKVIEGKELVCTTGLVDVGTYTGEPGYEHKETIAHLAAAAKAGGYTTLITAPNTKPFIQTKSDLNFLIQRGNQNHIQIYPMGALSHQGEGVDIAEYFDMHAAGAVGFSDGLRSCQDSGLLSRALLYVKAFDGLIVHHPEDKTLSGKGLMHEGTVSTSLGMKGVPELAEITMLQRDLLLLQYTESKLLVHGVSSGESIAILKKNKKENSRLFTSVSYLNLIATESNVEGFDVRFKVKPVLRSLDDQKKLIKGLSDEVIDIIVSNHVPVDEDGKKVEFPYADFGAGGIETSFIATIDMLGDKMELSDLVAKFNVNPRKIFGLEPKSIVEGESADICLFERNTSYNYTKTLSKSNNNPWLGKQFNTKIRATISGEHVYLVEN